MMQKFADIGLLTEGPSKPKRCTYQKPFSLELTLFDPCRVLRRFQGWCAFLTSNAMAVVVAVLGAFGLSALLSDGSWAGSVLFGRVPLVDYLLVLLALVIATFVHELAHAAALVASGGAPRRLGVMLFYLVPACFCDVSDAWRLPPRQRLRVALAGVTANWGMAGIAMVVALMSRGPVRAEATFFAEVSYVVVAFNLLPFVKLDGYVALSTYLDRPFLRNHAMNLARAELGSFIFGGRRPSWSEKGTLGAYEWAGPYGLLCLVAPFAIVVFAVGGLLPLLRQLGRPGAFVLGSIVIGAVFIAFRGTFRLAAAAFQRGGSPARVLTGVFVLGLAVAAAGWWVRIPDKVTGGFAAGPHGAMVVVAPGETTGGLRGGEEVALDQNGALQGPQVGTARLTAGFAACLVPLSDVLPVTESAGIVVHARCAPVSTIVSVKNADAFAEHLSSQGLWAWFSREVVNPLLGRAS
jgi:putative peptide zinc metalloprotease protein